MTMPPVGRSRNRSWFMGS